MNPYIVIAKVGKPHGLNGEFILHVFGDDPDELSRFSTLYLKKDDKYTHLQSFSMKVRGDRVVARFAGLHSREDAKKYCHSEIYAKKDDLPQTEEGEYYYIDLIDCRCLCTEEEIGVVQRMVNYGSCDLFEVKNESGKVFYIPFLNKLIRQIRLEEKVIDFNDLEGYI
ncbi:MAG: ribosome maturation factor RimM [bacterium]|nr:MAG: ribosome maturation factor RimM [bacterium]